MDRPTRRHNAPTYAISTKTKDEFSKRLLEKKYTKQEILTAVKTAEQLQGTVDFLDPIQVEQAWENVHAITCDEAWGVGSGNIVGAYLNITTCTYLRVLIEKTSEYIEPCSIANFMTRHIGQMLDPGFLRLLRAYLIAFPDTFEMPSTLEHMQFLYFDEVDEWTLHHPMIMASSSPLIPARILRTLLEGGISANTRNVKGDTALMLSCKGIRDDDKVDLLLNYGANIEDFNCDLENAFHFAVVYRNISTLRKLLSARTQRIQDASDDKEDHWDDDDTVVSSEFEGRGYETASSPEASQSTVEQSQDESDEEITKFASVMYEELLEKRIDAMENIVDDDLAYATRLRNRHLLYIDPIQMKNTCDESLIAFASKQCWISNRTSNEKHMCILQLLVDAGASPDGSIVSKRRIAHIRDDYHTDGYGIAKYWSRGDDEGTIVVTIQKSDYSVQVHFELEDFLGFIDLKSSSFPFSERPTANDMEKIFECMKFGHQFDYCNMNHVLTGDDFILDFYVSDYILDNNHHTYVKTGLNWCYLEKTQGICQEHWGRLVMRFPKGPVVMHHQFHVAFTTMNKGYTLLQHAMLQTNMQLRAHMFRAARVLCNPLITGRSGRTALQLLEESLKRNTKWIMEGRYSIAFLDRRDRGFLRHVRKDHDDMITHVFKNALLNQPNSILYNEAEKKIVDEYNLRKANNQARFSSVFHRLPDDVCANIIRFL